MSGDLQKDVLTDRKTRLEKTIRALENERADLAARLEETEEDLTARRALVRKLKVQAVLSTEADGCQVVDVSCVISSGRFVLRQLTYLLPTS